MSSSSAPPPPAAAPAVSTAWAPWLAGALIVAAATAPYHNSFGGPFVFDDLLAIPENPTIRRLWPLADVLFPPRGEGLSVEGRPVLNLTLALNYAVGGTAVRGYHAFNLSVHVLAALALFGLVRRTLLLPRLAPRFGAAALPLAAAVALLWAVHPLHTAAITYIIQRAEALVSLCYLATLYAFVRGVVAGGCAGWFTAAWTACLVGMATKEVMVSAPLLVLCYDRIFLAASWREVFRTRGRVHAALFGTWLLLGALVLGTGTRGGTAGFGIGVSPWTYALSQCESVVRYLGLAVWPSPLVFDYGVKWIGPAAAAPWAAVLLALLVATGLALRRAPAAGWLGLLFFAVLSPTSSFVPGNRQTMAEHRMYLPLAAVVTLVVLGTYLAARTPGRRRAAAAVAVVAVFAAGALTVRRNDDYRTVLALYRDTVAKRPDNGFARYNLAKVLAEAGDHAAAVGHFEAAARLMPGVAYIPFNLANSLAALGRTADAAAALATALRLDPRYAKAHFNLGVLRLGAGERAAAATHFRTALDLDPSYLEARANLGGVLLELGRLDDARLHLETVARARPDSVEAQFGLGNLHLLQRRWAEAATAFESVLRLRPDLAVARERLAQARAQAAAGSR